MRLLFVSFSLLIPLIILESALSVTKSKSWQLSEHVTLFLLGTQFSRRIALNHLDFMIWFMGNLCLEIPSGVTLPRSPLRQHLLTTVVKSWKVFKLVFYFNSYFHKTLHKISETNIAWIFGEIMQVCILSTNILNAP